MRQFGHKFRRQQPIGPYIVDVVCFAKKLLVELDGWTHSREQNYQHDDVRQDWLEARGFTVLRFTDDEVMADRAAVGDTIFTVSKRFRTDRRSRLPPSYGLRPSDPPARGDGQLPSLREGEITFLAIPPLMGGSVDRRAGEGGGATTSGTASAGA